MIVKEYDLINVSNLVEDYEYVFNKFNEIQSKDYRYFKIRKKGSSFNALTLKESDFPISIRNYRSGDKIRMTYGYKQINRYFIDKKIFLKDRISYPIIVNRSDEVILVIDGTIGQQEKSQVETFKKTINIGLIILSKLDGSVKGG